MALIKITEAERERRSKHAQQRAAARASRMPAPPPALNLDVPAVMTVWRTKDLPTPRSGVVGVPLAEGVSSVFLGSIIYIPIALVTQYAPWNYLVAAVAVVLLSYALWSRRVVVGPDFVALREFGPYRVARAECIVAGGMRPSSRGGVLVLRTGGGKTMRLRRAEYLSPAVNEELRRILSASDKPVEPGVLALLDMAYRDDLTGSRYLLDAVQ